MKREGRLMERIADPDNLRLAYWKARRGKDQRSEVAAYRRDLDANLAALRRDLLDGSVRVGDYFYFRIHDPKERMICAAAFGERVLHHAVMNVCHPIFERFQIDGSYATRIGKGQYAALDKARQHTRRYRWFCKLDVRKFFDSIDHERLYLMLCRKFKDPVLLDMFRRIISSYQTGPGRGLPIGNLTSQYFANFYLGHLDHFVLEKLHAHAYVRYMDDMVLWNDNKQDLIRITAELVAYVEKELGLAMKPPCINASELGIPFLGYVLFPSKVRLNRRSKKRFKRKMDIYAARIRCGEWTQQEYARHVEPLLAFTRYADALALRRCVAAKTGAG